MRSTRGPIRRASSIHPGSALARKAPRWLMAAELVDTGRLYARTVARIDPDWIERAGAHLIRTAAYSEPHWEKKAGQVVAIERGVLYGLTDLRAAARALRRRAIRSWRASC